MVLLVLVLVVVVLLVLEVLVLVVVFAVVPAANCKLSSKTVVLITSGCPPAQAMRVHGGQPGADTVQSHADCHRMQWP